MRKTQQKLKNQHAANRRLQYGINGLLLEVMASRHFSEQDDFAVREKLPVGIRKFILPLRWYHSYVQKVSFLCYFCNWKVLSIDIEWKNVFFVKWAFLQDFSVCFVDISKKSMCVANDYVSVRIRATDYIEKCLLSTFMQVVLQVRETQLGKNLEDSIGKRLFTGRYYLRQLIRCVCSWN